MVCVLYSRCHGDRKTAFERKAVFRHTDGTVEYVKHYEHSDTYEIRCYGVNKLGVPFRGCEHLYNNKIILFFQCCCGKTETTLAQMVAEAGKDLDKLRKLLYK